MKGYWLNYYFPEMLRSSIVQMPSFNQIKEATEEAGLQGISSFASLANLEEVNQGLAKLKHDLQTGDFEQIKNKYENSLGDYLFITIEGKGSI